ncbi:MAG TPA: glycosyltransferase family 4 protein [Streptosporangiaceae bacterium]|jgi:glycosyltransferase involved in cell wall biosynthesis|nr:glycosyltransferase family 4 protein [Streptosporangiaceae bacterium]
MVLGTASGGTAGHVAMLAAGCAAQGHQVTVYGPARTARFFPAAGFAPVDIGDRPRPGRDLAAVLRLRGLLARSRPEVVHAHGLRAAAAAALAVLPGAGGARIPLAVTVHNAPPSGGWARAVHGLLEWLTARRADAVACVSADLAARMRSRGARDVSWAPVPARLVPVPDTGEVAAIRAGLAGDGQPVVLAAGRLAPQKGFATLLTAAARWQNRDPCPVVVLAGQGPLDQALRAQADATGIRMRFLGQREDIPALLAGADVVVVPSVWEGQPLIVQEALRAGRPLVASRTGGIPDLTGGDAAVLVPPGDAAALAGAVLSVLDDPALAAKLSVAAFSRATALPGEQAAIAAALALYQRITAS